MTRGSFLLGALLALALGGLAFFGAFDEVRGGELEASRDAVQPGASGAPAEAVQQGSSSDLEMPVQSGQPEGLKRGPELVEVDLATRRSSDASVEISPVMSAGSSVPASVLGALMGPEGPVRGAQVVLKWSEQNSAATWVEDTSSDEDGAFALRTKRLKGDLVLEVHARGFAPHRSRIRRLVPGEARNLGTIRLAPGRVLDIDVTDADGRALGGAKVVVESVGKAGANAFRHEGVTADHGRLRFLDAPLGPLRVQASAEDNGSRILIHEHKGGGRALRVALLPERNLTIRVRSSDGVPISSALVLLTASDQRHESYEVNSDDAGLAQFEGLGSQRFDARVVAKGFRTDTRRKLEANGKEIVFEMLPWPCLRLQVQAPAGQTIPAGTLARAVPNTSRAALLRSPTSSNSIAGEAVSVGPDGEVRLCDLRPGEYVVRVDAPGYATTLSDSIRVALDSDPSLGTLTLSEGGTLAISLRAQEDSSVLGGAQVELHVVRPAPAALVNETPAFRAAVLESTQTDANGNARFEHLAPGDYTVLLRAPGRQARLGGPIRVSAGRQADLGPIKLTRGSIVRGIVRRSGGSPVTNAIVVMRGTQADAPVQLSTNAKGEFTSPPLSPGAWQLTASSFGTQSGSTPIERSLVLKPGKNLEQLELIFVD